MWQARAARFILGAANRSRPAATGPYEGNAFLLLGVEPGRAMGTNIVDPAKITQALVRYLGSVGPHYSLDYVTVDGGAVAVSTVPVPPTGNRPYLARGTFSGEREEIRDGRIYIRRSGTTAEATADEIAGRVAVFDRLLDRADAEPYQVVEETWAPLRAIVVDVYEQLIGPLPFESLKVNRMMERLAASNSWNQLGSMSPSRSITGRMSKRPRR